MSTKYPAQLKPGDVLADDGGVDLIVSSVLMDPDSQNYRIVLFANGRYLRFRQNETVVLQGPATIKARDVLPGMNLKLTTGEVMHVETVGTTHDGDLLIAGHQGGSLHVRAARHWCVPTPDYEFGVAL